MLQLERHTIFVTLAGSQAHGTARETSDVDLRGVCVAPLSLRLSLFRTFEQYEGELSGALLEAVLPRLKTHPSAARGLATKTECVIYDVAKFLRLCADANPNALEILFADERDWVFETPAWRRLYDRRHGFLTKKVQATFLGYAMAQLKKIRSHRSWLLHPPARKPSRTDFGLPSADSTIGQDLQYRIERTLTEKIRSYGIDAIDMPAAARIEVQERLEELVRDQLAASADDLDDRLRAVAGHALDLPTDLMAALGAETRYRTALKHWDSYQTWKRQRNPARADLERAHGYDTKHAMHLVRLMRMGLEILEHGDLSVRRQDASELAAIRDGALSFDELLAMTARMKTAMEAASATTRLPADVDRRWADELVLELTKNDG